ncbi:MAG: hypothetical protein L6R38_002206 [Xanthoria sp. 2 TBL-2021]|nr:MAG: hypothetical protein L6R38_002206 [Xanthoria sp. 2 TBL-2021]
MLFLLYRVVSILTISLLSFATAYPTFSLPDDDVIQSLSTEHRQSRNPRRSSQNKLTRGSILNPRLAPARNPEDPYHLPDDISSLLNLPVGPPPRTEYHLTLTSYHAFLSNLSDSTSIHNASASLLPFYNSITSLIADLTRQNKKQEKAIAFGGKRFWLNFYAMGDEALEWKDLAWCAGRWVELLKRGVVGRWQGVLLPPGQGKGIRVELRLLERLRGEER